MKKNFLILFMAFLGGCASAPTSENQADDFTIVDLGHVADKNRLVDDIVDSLQIIKFEMTDKSLLSDMLKIELGDNFIYVLDRSANALKIFTLNGDFHKDISQGRGPGEVMFPSVVRYVASKKKLYVYQDGLINCYTEDGLFIRNYEIPYLVDDFVKVGENFVCFQFAGRSMSQQTTMMEIAPDMNVVSSLTLEQSRLEYGMNNMSINYKGGINIFRPLDNNIYTFKNGKFLVSKQLDFNCPDYDLSSLESDHDYRGFDKYAANHPEIFSLSDFYNETADYEMYRVTRGSMLNLKTVFRNKKNGELFETISESNPKPSIINNLNFVGAYKDYFVAYCSFYAVNGILDHVADNELSMKADDVEIFKNMTEEDNPILVLVKLKNN
ncbi:MAG: 6-bladed beta-propeller [Salinivirgaceae bacterium]|nr:6-bladed beta-propeller [Salinivirgaceae bacterium]